LAAYDIVDKRCRRLGGAVKEGRERWRSFQMKAAVRDAPEAAAEVLRLLDYDVTPKIPPPRDNMARLHAH